MAQNFQGFKLGKETSQKAVKVLVGLWTQLGSVSFNSLISLDF